MSKKILLVEPQKSKKYHTAYPPLGLLKLSALHKKKGDTVRLANGIVEDGYKPDEIYITSLFTYAWEPVHGIISSYRESYKKARIVVGGIYATLCADNLKKSFKNDIEIHKGLVSEAEGLLPDYSLVPDWKASIIFASRGCIRKCPFCSVPKIEPKFEAKRSIKHLVYPGHKKIIFWDNNFLASPYWKNILKELEELALPVDFNQGLDARLLTEEVALRLRRIKIPIVRLAYDSMEIRKPLKNAIKLLKNLGVDGRKIVVYCLYNFLDTPEDFLLRTKDLLDWGVVSYPMRYQSLEPGTKDQYISPNWSKEQLEMVAKARRVIGYGGAFPPYEGLKKKILDTNSFESAFSLKPIER